MKNETDYEFCWDNFTEKNLTKLNKNKGNAADVYGCIHVFSKTKKYIVDVALETKAAYDRDGISLEVYESGEKSKKDWYHRKFCGDSKAINTAKDYNRFVTRAEKEVTGIIKEWEE